MSKQQDKINKTLQEENWTAEKVKKFNEYKPIKVVTSTERQHILNKVRVMALDREQMQENIRQEQIVKCLRSIKKAVQRKKHQWGIVRPSVDSYSWMKAIDDIVQLIDDRIKKETK